MSQRIIIASDSSCDLSPELIKMNDIRIIPLHVNIDSKEYSDGVDINSAKLFKLVEETGKAPKTSAVSPEEFIRFFKGLLDENPEAHIIYTGIGSSLSAAFQSAHIAKQIIESDRIHLIDSKNLSTGIGLILLKAVEYIKRGWTLEKILLKLESFVSRIKVQFVIKTLEYLKKGGRCKGVTFIIGTLLKIRPMIAVREGKLVVGRKVIGPMKKACTEMLKVVKQDIEKIDPQFCFITHCEGHESIDLIKQEIDNLNVFKNVYITEAGSTISSHCGPGCIGILYALKHEDVTLEYEEEDI